MSNLYLPCLTNKKNECIMNMCDKIDALLKHHYNLFHSDMIYDAIMDRDISTEDFIQGIKTIGWAERNDEDEFVPTEFK